MAEITTNRSGICTHRNRGETETIKCPQIGNKHPVIGMARAGLIEIDADAAPAHRRRPRYSGKHPRKFEEKYKEHDPQRYADTVAKVVEEIAAVRITERGATRGDDKVSEAAMEDRKKEGYF